MIWQIKVSDQAKKELAKIDKTHARRILSFLRDRIATSDNPQYLGKALKGQYATLWRYRIGDYRIICDFNNDELIVLILRVGHRKDVY